MRTRPLFLFLVCAIASTLLFGCLTQRVSRELTEVDKAKSIKAHYLKAHLKDGSLYVFSSWKADQQARMISGNAKLYNFNRKLSSAGKTTIPYDAIAILETNDKSDNPGIATMVILGIATVPIALHCLINPKACFGSCPTFYVQNGEAEVLVGEGFSSSICKAMEEIDVDLINCSLPQNQPAQLIVKNEALETHLIRGITLLVVEKNENERVLQSLEGKFYRIGQPKEPLRATSGNHSIQKKLSVKDHEEWYSLADSFDLSKKEDVFLEFENHGNKSGLVIDKRHTLLTTFLFYHSLALTGEATGFYLAEIENGNGLLKQKIEKFYNLMGGIEVAILDPKNKWSTIGTIREAGPIVSDMHLVNLPEVKTKTIKVRLRMTKGLWRIDMVNLAPVMNEVIPERILPENVFKNSRCDSVALNTLLDPDEYLVTYPGDFYTLNFPTVFSANKEYFIESQGYYIEWMRDEWLQHQDLKLAKKMFLNPAKYLKQIAPAYKAVEPEMEKVFWNSRYPVNHEN